MCRQSSEGEGNTSSWTTSPGGQQKTRYTFHADPLDEASFRAFWIRSFDPINAVVASRFIDDKFIYIHDNYVQVRSMGNIEKFDHPRQSPLTDLEKYFSLNAHTLGTAHETPCGNIAGRVPEPFFKIFSSHFI
ncbi:MAG: hypothetical protein U5N26_07550 [Candidatus Marinimicrobia bacterium]|nr:hypothetical protein [Candidatus Neomarinimicrobiota bacterium]